MSSTQDVATLFEDWQRAKERVDKWSAANPNNMPSEMKVQEIELIEAQTAFRALDEQIKIARGDNYPEMVGSQSPLRSAAKSQSTETKEQRQDRRLAQCEAAGLPMDKMAAHRLPNGVGAIANKEGISRQAFSEDVKTAIKRREKNKKEGVIVHRI